MKKSNYLYLGMAASLFAIAIIQWITKGLLPIKIYASIAWVSLDLTILELIKTIFQYIQTLHARQIKLTLDELDLCDRQINAMGKFDVLKAEVEKHTEFRSVLIERAEKLNQNKSIHRLGKVVDILSVAQIVSACVMVTITALKDIPNDLTSNKIIGILSLLAFAFLIFSYFIKNWIETLLVEFDSDIKNTNMLSKYYLDILEKAVPKDQ